MGVVHAGQVIEQALGEDLDGRHNDLSLIQRVLEQGVVEPEATYTLQASASRSAGRSSTSFPTTTGGSSKTSMAAIPRSVTRKRACWCSR